MVDKESLRKIADQEGGISEEQTFDGHRLQWSDQAKKALRNVPRGYMRRNVKARIEKSARTRKIGTITNDFAMRIVNESMDQASSVREDAPELKEAAQSRKSSDPTQGEAFESEFEWTPDARERLESRARRIYAEHHPIPRRATRTRSRPHDNQLGICRTGD